MRRWDAEMQTCPPAKSAGGSPRRWPTEHPFSRKNNYLQNLNISPDLVYGHLDDALRQDPVDGIQGTFWDWRHLVLSLFAVCLNLRRRVGGGRIGRHFYELLGGERILCVDHLFFWAETQLSAGIDSTTPTVRQNRCCKGESNSKKANTRNKKKRCFPTYPCTIFHSEEKRRYSHTCLFGSILEHVLLASIQFNLHAIKHFSFVHFRFHSADPSLPARSAASPRCPAASATSAGVLPSESTASVLAPSSARTAASSTRPSEAARWRGDLRGGTYSFFILYHMRIETEAGERSKFGPFLAKRSSQSATP